MTSLSHAFSPLTAKPARRTGSISVLHYLRHSRALASLLPAFLASGLMTLLISAMMRMLLSTSQAGFLHVWMESWLVTWPIGFPLVYLAQQAMVWLMDGGDEAESASRVDTI